MPPKSRITRCIIDTLRRAAWAPTLVFISNKVALDVLGLGESYPAIDIPMHLLGGTAIAYFFHAWFAEGVRSEVFQLHDRATHLALVLGWTSLAALAWELYEWFSEVFLKWPILGDVHDTIGDLVLGVLGGAIFLASNALLSWRRMP
jgi:hypothetical protein